MRGKVAEDSKRTLIGIPGSPTCCQHVSYMHLLKSWRWGRGRLVCSKLESLMSAVRSHIVRTNQMQLLPACLSGCRRGERATGEPV